MYVYIGGTAGLSGTYTHGATVRRAAVVVDASDRDTGRRARCFLMRGYDRVASLTPFAWRSPLLVSVAGVTGVSCV